MALDKAKLDSIRAQAQKANEASMSVAQNMFTLWSAQLDMAIATEDEEMIKQLVAQQPKPLYLDWNCGCGSGKAPPKKK